jgi:TolB-like protein
VTFSFGDYELDVDRRELNCGGESVALEPQVFDLLVYLVSNRHRVVSKDDLVENIWAGRIVSESTLTSRLNAARRVIGDSGAAQTVIRTIPRKGVRFVAEVWEKAQLVPGLATASEPQAMPAVPDKPSIAVLPFQNMSGDPEQEYFVDGMVEEIITALSRIRWLFVLARHSSFAYKGQSIDVKQVGRELGVRYVLEGSVRKGGNRVRITGQLIDAVTGAHLWADRFDGSLCPRTRSPLPPAVQPEPAGPSPPTRKQRPAERYDECLRPIINAIEKLRCNADDRCDVDDRSATARDKNRERRHKSAVSAR